MVFRKLPRCLLHSKAVSLTFQYINLPLSALSLVLVTFLLPLRRVKGSIMSKLRRLDYYGSFLTLAWAISFLLALSWAGNQYPWVSVPVLLPLILGLVLLGAFILVEIKLVPLPLIPFHILKIPTVAATMLATLFSGFGFYSSLYYLPQYFQIVRGESAIQSGVLILPLVLVQTCAAFGSGFLVSKTGDYWWNMLIGFTVWTIGIGLLSTIDPTTSIGKLSGYQVLVGLGAGQTFQTSLLAIQASVHRKEMATATGLRNFLRMLGGTLGLTVCTTIISNIVTGQLSDAGMSEEMIRGILSDPTRLDGRGLTDAQRQQVLYAYCECCFCCGHFQTSLRIPAKLYDYAPPAGGILDCLLLL